MTAANLRSINKRFAAVPDAVRSEVKVALAKSADELVAMMKRLVPVDEGDLRDSIGWTWGAAPKGTVKVGGVDAGGKDLAVTVFAGGPGAYHAHLVEFGTVKSAAQPYFLPAWRALRTRIRRRIATAVSKGVKKAWNR